ncbi:hypothetical protein ACHAXN_003350 [Cyclotella atomus]
MFNPKIIALPLSGLCSIAAALIYTVYLAARTSPSDQPASSRTDYIPIAYIAVSSMLVYYIFLMCQSAVSFYEFFKAEHEYYNKKKGGVKPSVIKIKYGSENFNVLAANRTVANYSEQIIPFLVSLCLCASFVSVARATTLGWMWLVFRSYYPLVYMKGPPILFLSTLPAYTCVWMMLGETVMTISKVV